MNNDLIIQYAKHNILLYKDMYGIPAPSINTLKRWQKVLEVSRKVEYISKRFKKSTKEIVESIYNLNTRNIDECAGELLRIFSINNIIEVKDNKEVLNDLLLVASLIRNNQLPNMILSTLKNNYISERTQAIRREIVKTMNEMKWETDTERFYVVLDTETNSLPRGDMPSRGFPIQLSYLIMNNNKEVVAARSNYITPVFAIDPSAEKIHCMSKSFLEYKGYSPSKVWNDFKNDMDMFQNKVFVAHNATFDLNALSKLAWHVRQPEIEFDSVECTLKYFRNRKDLNKKSNKLVDIQIAYGIKDEEVKQKVLEYYNVEIGNPHNAMYDTALLSLILQKDDVNIIV